MKATKKERKKRKAKICFKFGQQQKHSIQEETAIARKKKASVSHIFFVAILQETLFLSELAWQFLLFLRK